MSHEVKKIGPPAVRGQAQPARKQTKTANTKKNENSGAASFAPDALLPIDKYCKYNVSGKCCEHLMGIELAASSKTR
jgi:hypothetical protein